MEILKKVSAQKTTGYSFMATYVSLRYLNSFLKLHIFCSNKWKFIDAISCFHTEKKIFSGIVNIESLFIFSYTH